MYVSGVAVLSAQAWGRGGSFPDVLLRGGAQVDGEDLLAACQERKMALEEMLVQVAREAVAEAPRGATDETLRSCGLVVACAGAESLEEPASSVVESVAKQLGVSGPRFVFTNACSSGLAALEAAEWLMESGRAERVLVLGAAVPAAVQRSGFAGLSLIGGGRCMPFDEGRKYIMLGEAAACLLLDRAHCPGPGALPPISVGPVCQRYSSEGMITPDWRAVAAVMLGAAAGQSVDLIIAHGTGTGPNDAAESQAVQHAFPGGVWVTSIKSTTGHTLEASGLLNVISAVLALRSGRAPVTRNTTRPILRAPTRLVGCGGAPEAPCRTALCCAYGIDGNHAAVLVSRSARRAEPTNSRSVHLSKVSDWVHESDADVPANPARPGEPVGAGPLLVIVAVQRALASAGVTAANRGGNFALWLVTRLRQPGRPPTPYPTGRRTPPADFLGTVASYTASLAARALGISDSVCSLSSSRASYLDVVGLAADAVRTRRRDTVCLAFLESARYDGRARLRARAIAVSSDRYAMRARHVVYDWGAVAGKDDEMADGPAHRILEQKLGEFASSSPATRPSVVIWRAVHASAGGSPLDVVAALADGQANGGLTVLPALLLSVGHEHVSWMALAACPALCEKER